VNEERDGLFPRRHVAIDPRGVFVPLFVLGSELGFAGQVARIFIQILFVLVVVIRLVGQVARLGGTRDAWSAGRSLFARATLTAVARSTAATAPAAATRTTRALGVFGFALGAGFVAFLNRALVECGLVERGLVGKLGCVFGNDVRVLLFESLRLRFFARSFVTHKPLPIHRSCGFLTSRPRTSPPAPAPGRTGAAILGLLGIARGGLSALVELLDFVAFGRV
jgi:hypothetical protein